MAMSELFTVTALISIALMIAAYWQSDDDGGMRNIPLAPMWSAVTDPDLKALLHPALAFDHPREVVSDPDLTTEEKRAILSSWASDACSVESQPAMRLPPGAKHPVCFDEIVDALRSLDSGPLPKWKRALRRQRSDSNENPDGSLSLT
jgi:hypothetical protein